MSIKQNIYISELCEFQIGDLTDGRATQAIDRYAEILRRECVEDMFSESEWNALRDLLNGVFSAPANMICQSLGQVWGYSQEDGVAEKWNVDPSEMMTKLKALSYSQEVAVIDAVERWWNSQRH